MKKSLIITFVLLLTSSFLQAQTTPITDTLKYLKKEIQVKKGQYIGKPLSTLFNDLKLDVAFTYDNLYENANKPDPISSDYLILKFNLEELTVDSATYFQRKEGILPRPFYYCIMITFATPAKVHKALLQPGGILGPDNDWSAAKESFWGQFTVGDIDVLGPKAERIYSRIEFSNFSEDRSTDCCNDILSMHADAYVRFYSDINCTKPYYLNKDIDQLIVKERYDEAWDFEVGYNVPAGENEVYLGNKLIMSEHYIYDNNRGEWLPYSSSFGEFFMYSFANFTFIPN